MLDVTARAINDYTDKVGAYPYPALNIAETGPWASIESPGLFWIADNVPGHLLQWTTAHEVAHEWFYATVGNDQAREPFADEALADFMARNLLDRFVPSQCPPGFLDQSIYDLGDCYPWVVYVQGNLWLRDYRDHVGSATFWRGVADYYSSTSSEWEARASSSTRWMQARAKPSSMSSSRACTPCRCRASRLGRCPLSRTRR